jgi:hypothetical protein
VDAAKAVVGLRPSFSAQVRGGEPGAPVDSLRRGYQQKGLPVGEALLLIELWKGYWLTVLMAGALEAESVVSFSAK